MKIRYQCSCCGQQFQSSAIVGIAEGLYALGCRAVGDAFYCEGCVKTWASRNGKTFDGQYHDSKKMFIKWWNREVDAQNNEEKNQDETKSSLCLS